MGAMRLVVMGLLALGVMLAMAGSAAAVPVRQCGNYGFPEGHTGSKPIFTSDDIAGAGVSDIITKVARCRTVRRMVRRFWAGRWADCTPGCRRGSFRCRDRQLGDEFFRMRCTASRGRVVRFNYGA
jgi:hypothetical protein